VLVWAVIAYDGSAARILKKDLWVWLTKFYANTQIRSVPGRANYMISDDELMSEWPVPIVINRDQ
jgi:hypothetical protein